MRYWKIIYDFNIYIIEVDKFNLALRQINYAENSTIEISCFDDCLLEGEFIPEYLEGEVVEISKSEFDERWNSVINHYKYYWEKTKKIYRIGSLIEGNIIYFYPQGAILRLKDGLACYVGTLTSYEIDIKVKGKVNGYDEKNMWVIVT